MRTTTLNSQVSSYWNMVKHLSPEAKIDLIMMLTRSLKPTTPKSISAKEYYGIWGDDGLADDEFVNELKSLRNFNKEIVEI